MEVSLQNSPKRVGEEETHSWPKMECATAAFKRRVQMGLVFGACYKEKGVRSLSSYQPKVVPRLSKQVRAVVSLATNPAHSSPSPRTWLHSQEASPLETLRTLPGGASA